MRPLLDQVQYLTLKEQALTGIYLTLWIQDKPFHYNFLLCIGWKMNQLHLTCHSPFLK